MSEPFPASRNAALARWEKFSPEVAEYARRRNFVVPENEGVSRLSPAVGCRLIGEEELAGWAVEAYGLKQCEKFVQEVYWRLYWKSWLEMRPGVWLRYRRNCDEIRGEWEALVSKTVGGESGIAIFDYFVEKLRVTGYLHNHERMWFAAMWVHTFRLPWQLGAEWFYGQLLDGDAAANTLSWRWVAGLHTKGKNYLARASNLKRFLDASILDQHRCGLSKIANPAAVELKWEKWGIQPVMEREVDISKGAVVGVWLHEEDLQLEEVPVGDVGHVVTVVDRERWKRAGHSELRQKYHEAALGDGLARAEEKWGANGKQLVGDTAKELLQWAFDNGVDTIVAARPWVGWLGDAMGDIRHELIKRGISLQLHRRELDRVWLEDARTSFGGFWHLVEPRLRQAEEDVTISPTLPGFGV